MDERNLDTPAERLLSLFTTRKITREFKKAGRPDGGLTKFCKISGLSPATVSRWRHNGERGTGGRIPPIYNQAILDACDRQGVPRSAVADLLEPAVCPSCGKPMDGESLVAVIA